MEYKEGTLGDMLQHKCNSTNRVYTTHTEKTYCMSRVHSITYRSIITVYFESCAQNDLCTCRIDMKGRAIKQRKKMYTLIYLTLNQFA